MSDLATRIERIERLLAAILLKQMSGTPDNAKMVVLKQIGYGNQEIAELVGTTAAVVSQRLYEARDGAGLKKATAKPRKAR